MIFGGVLSTLVNKISGILGNKATKTLNKSIVISSGNLKQTLPLWRYICIYKSSGTCFKEAWVFTAVNIFLIGNSTLIFVPLAIVLAFATYLDNTLFISGSFNIITSWFANSISKFAVTSFIIGMVFKSLPVIVLSNVVGLISLISAMIATAVGSSTCFCAITNRVILPRPFIPLTWPLTTNSNPPSTSRLPDILGSSMTASVNIFDCSGDCSSVTDFLENNFAKSDAFKLSAFKENIPSAESRFLFSTKGITLSSNCISPRMSIPILSNEGASKNSL